MQRRALLAALATGASGLAGCSGDSDQNTTASTTTGPETTTTTSTGSGPHTTEPGPKPPNNDLWGATTAVLETGDRTLSALGGNARLPSGVRVRTWLSDTATAEHPAIVTVTLRNPTKYATNVRLREIGQVGETPFASPDRDYSKDAGMYLVPTEDHEFALKVPAIDRDGEFWYLDERPGDWHPPDLQLDPGEVAVARLAVVTHVDAKGRLPPARYRFGHHHPLTIVAWQTSRPGPTERSRFENTTPPEFEEMNPAWYHDAGPETPVYLQPSNERVASPAEIEFTLHNYTTDTLTGNRYDWSLEKHVDGEWFHVAPWAIPLPLTPVPPGGTESWSLHAFYETSVPCDDAIDLGFLGGGRYAFQVNLHPKEDPTRSALFDLVAPAVDVVPTKSVDVSQSGDTVDVSDPVSGDQNRGVFVVERTESGSSGESIIPEQVMRRRNRSLRNTLPFFESGVSTVRLSTTEQTVDDAVGYDGDSRQFTFEGQTYIATRGS